LNPFTSLHDLFSLSKPYKQGKRIKVKLVQLVSIKERKLGRFDTVL